MKRILCFGDSNTWGSIPGEDGRYDENQRYTRLLQKLLGKDYEIIEEGLKARTTSYDDINDFKGNMSGSAFFGQCVSTHDPIDCIVVFLGTNDLKYKFNCTAKDSAHNIEKDYIGFVNKYASHYFVLPKFIIVAPSLIDESMLEEYRGANLKSKEFSKEYKKIAEKYNCGFVDNDILQCGVDGIHLLPESHVKLAGKLADLIKKMFE